MSDRQLPSLGSTRSAQTSLYLEKLAGEGIKVDPQRLVITTPGRYEGAQAWVPFYHDVITDGCAGETVYNDDGSIDYTRVSLDPSDAEIWPHFREAGAIAVEIREGGDGYVSGHLVTPQWATEIIASTNRDWTEDYLEHLEAWFDHPIFMMLKGAAAYADYWRSKHLSLLSQGDQVLHRHWRGVVESTRELLSGPTGKMNRHLADNLIVRILDSQ